MLTQVERRNQSDKRESTYACFIRGAAFTSYKSRWSIERPVLFVYNVFFAIDTNRV